MSTEDKPGKFCGGCGKVWVKPAQNGTQYDFCFPCGKAQKAKNQKKWAEEGSLCVICSIPVDPTKGYDQCYKCSQAVTDDPPITGDLSLKRKRPDEWNEEMTQIREFMMQTREHMADLEQSNRSFTDRLLSLEHTVHQLQEVVKQ